MLSEAPVFIRRAIRFCMLIPLYVKLVTWKEVKIKPFKLAQDLLYIFFSLRYFPDNYGPCRLWEKPRKEWHFYYGSTYNSYPRKRLRKLVQRYNYQTIFNDKAVCEQLCMGLKLKMPATYGFLSKDDDYRKALTSYFSHCKKPRLIIKPLLGHAGIGISMAHHQDGIIKVESGKKAVLLDQFTLQEDCLVQEVVEQHAAISQIAPNSVNTVRVVTLLSKQSEIIVVSSTMRFGVGNAFVDNWSAGGVAVGVEPLTGCLRKVAYDKKGAMYLNHPATGVVFENYAIPYWSDIIKTAKTVQQACPFYRLIGMDICVGQEEPILIEVNANADIIFQEQTSGPLLKDPNIFAKFLEYDLLYNKFQKNLYTM